MTRLSEADLAGQAGAWAAYARRMRENLAAELPEVCARALDLPGETVRRKLAAARVGIVPVSSGEGRIGGFAELLAATATFLGCAAHILPPDDAGFAQARAGACDLLLWADDVTYMAENLRDGSRAENGWATGCGFAAALDGMARRHHLERRALVLGAGPVGCSAAAWLGRHGYAVTLCDIVPLRAQARAAGLPACTGVEPAALAALPPFACLLDATPTGECFPRERLSDGACVSAPGVPCRWPGRLPVARRFWHDPLQLGTAVMLAAAACGVGDASA